MLILTALHQAQAQGLPRLDAQLLLLQALERAPLGRAWLAAHDTDALELPALARFQALCQRRLAREPLAYITGNAEFFGLSLSVDARVLDPRPDTETLVHWALETLADMQDQQPPAVLDLGTGSGAVALAIAHAAGKNPGDLRVTATDASADALALARSNALQLGLDVEFVQGNWFAPLGLRQFDVIVSNPPYVRADDPHLAALRYEPLNALVSGPDGLGDLRAIVAAAPAHLQAGGWLLLEHGYDQAEQVRMLLQQAGLVQAQSRRDLAGIERCSGAQRPPA